MPRNLSIILVAGGWHTEEHVKPVTPYLEKHGYHVVPIKLRTSGRHDPLPVIQDNVGPIVSAMKSGIASGSNICLVGHSVSGQSCVLAANDFLATASEADKAKFVEMVFISCFLNPIRATAGTDWYDIDMSTMWAGLRSADEIYAVFYNDMPRDEAQPYIDALDSNRAQMPPENIPDTWKQIKGTYFLCLKDKAIAPEKQRPEAEENGMKIVEVEMDHCCYYSLTATSRNTAIVASQAEAEAYSSSTTPVNTGAAMDKLRAIGTTVSSSVTPFAARGQQWFKEQTGNAGEKTELPHDYVELETRIEALKVTHQKLLAATSQYANEAYDYPPNIRESFQDMGKSISEKVGLLSKAGSAAEAQAALTAPPTAKPQPKTFNHAIARASLAGSQTLATATPQGSTEPDPLSQGLEKFAIAQEKVGEARLEQDEAIQGKFLAGWMTTLNQSLKSADKARTAVNNARLSLDAAKGRAAASGKHEESYTEPQRKAIEAAEDEFVAKVDEATSIMRNVLDTPEPLRNLAELVKAQYEYHQKATEILEDVSKSVTDIQMDHEANYRKARDQ